MFPVRLGSITQTVTGSGQVSAENQLDVTSEVSGKIQSINVEIGQHVSKGALLATIDSHDAEINLESARIAYAKLVKPAKDGDVTNAQNSLSKAYSDGFNAVSTTYLDLPAIMTGMKDMLYGRDGFLSDQKSSYLTSVGRIYRNDAGVSYDKALRQYQTTLGQYKNLTKTYMTGDNATHALRGVTFTINDGEFIAIMGPSGSGKSTLMHILGALDTPSSGTYKLDGQDVSKLSDDELAEIRRDQIGFVFQAFNLLPRATVLRNVTLPLIYAGIPAHDRESRARIALKSAGMTEDRFQHKSNQLSGGQIQRVAIARALVNNPTLILADEPTGNLDTQTGNIVLGTFQNLNKQFGRTIILITHEREVAEHADRIIHIRDGEIVEDSMKHTKRIIKHSIQ